MATYIDDDKILLAVRSALALRMSAGQAASLAQSKLAEAKAVYEAAVGPGKAHHVPATEIKAGFEALKTWVDAL